MADPTPIRCPADTPPTSVDELLDPLLRRLADPAPVLDRTSFPRGTLQPDGRLDLCKQALAPLDVARIVPAAVASGHTRHLLLGTNGLGAPGIATLAGALTPGHGIRTLYLGCNHVDAAGVRPLTDRLATDDTVRAVWLKRNPLGDDGVASVASALRGNTTVRTVDLTNTGLTAAGLRVLVDALRQRSVPTDRVYLGGNGLGPEAAELLATLVREVGVRELYLACGRLGDDGAAALAAAVPPGGAVTLGLGGNGIGPDGVRALADRLDGLVALDLARPPSAIALQAVPNTVGDAGASALAAALPGSPLRRLDLRHTGVTGRGARLLLAAVDQGTQLELLGLGSGVPRRIKRAVGDNMRPASPPAEDVHAIASVYR